MKEEKQKDDKFLNLSYESEIQQQAWVCIPLEAVKEYLKLKYSINNLCIHVDETPICNRSNRPIQEPVLASDGFLYEKTIIQRYLERSNISPATRNLLPSKELISVRIATQRELKSKLDPEKTIRANEPLVLFCRLRHDDDSALIMLEKQTEHGYGMLLTYRFTQKVTSDSLNKADILIEAFDHLHYATLTTESLLQRYHITKEQVQACSYSCQIQKAIRLEAEIQRDVKRLAQKKLGYHFRSDKAGVSFWGFFIGQTFYNSCTWGRSVLSRAGILSTHSIHYDNKYPIRLKNSSISFFLGATPDQVMPLPLEQEKSSQKIALSAGVFS